MDTKTKNLIIAVLIYVVSAVVSFFVFSQFGGGGGNIATPLAQPKVEGDQRVAFNDTLPKTQECPLNGARYSKPQRDWWEKHRPLGVMIENHQESRPQSGITYAHVIY